MKLLRVLSVSLELMANTTPSPMVGTIRWKNMSRTGGGAAALCSSLVYCVKGCGFVPQNNEKVTYPECQ